MKKNSMSLGAAMLVAVGLSIGLMTSIRSKVDGRLDADGHPQTTSEVLKNTERIETPAYQQRGSSTEFQLPTYLKPRPASNFTTFPPIFREANLPPK